MASQDVKFSCAILANKNKQGILRPDDDGYFTVILGALDVYNSVGEFYTYSGAKQLFESSSGFMRRVNAGVLKGENGHPAPLPGQSLDDYAVRVMTIREENVSHHISEVWIDTANVKDDSGRSVIAIMGKVRPTGPMGPALLDSLNNPKDNTCFSIRAFTEDSWIAGTKQRALKTIVTWDWVIESGLAIARKYNTPGLEAYRQRHLGAITLESIQETTFNRTNFQQAISPSREGIATESTKSFGLELFNEMGWRVDNAQNVPAYARW